MSALGRALGIALLLATTAAAEEPLHARIDRLIESDQVAAVAPGAGDQEFLRRASLDLIGRIPSLAEVREFAGDASPDKRGALVDRLLASPEYARHMAGVFDVVLMERRPEKNAKIAPWQRYVEDSLAANKSYDQLVREILSADGADPAQRAQARFYLDREAEANLLARDVGRVFLGVDLRCAQCHDHPLVADYYQADYQGLYAFFNRTSLFTDKEKNVSLAEKADGDVNYQSVFDASHKGTALPKLPDGEPVTEPAFNKGEEYTVAPADGVRPVPKYSRRAQLAPRLTASKMFARAIANRLWAHMMGRGLVEPVDLHHSDNPPSHPAVLALVADSFAATKYDIKALLGQLARTRAYARSIDLPAELHTRRAELEPQLAAWEAEQAKLDAGAQRSRDAATAEGAELAAARAAAAPATEEMAKAQAAAAEAKKNADAATQTLTSAQSALPGKQEAARLVGEASARTAEAAQKLADDKELAGAAAKLKTRSEQLAAEVAALAKTVSEGPAAVKATAEQLGAAEQAVAAIKPRLEPLAARVAELLATAKAADAQARSDHAALVAMTGRIDDAKALVAFSQAAASAGTAGAVIAKAEVDLAAAHKAVADFQPETDRASRALAAAREQSSAASAALEEARKQLAERKSTADAVAEALTKTEIASKKLPDAAELAVAVAALQKKSSDLAAELKPHEAILAEREVATKAAGEAVAKAEQDTASAAAQRDNLAKQASALEQAVAAAREDATSASAASEAARRKVIERQSARCAVATLKHLTPEQLAWSMMQASGALARERAAVEAEWNKNHPTPDAAAQEARPREIEQAFNDKMKAAATAFVSLFAAAPGQPQQDFQATVDQALFLANGGPLRSWIAPADGNLTDRLAKIADPREAANELYLTVLSRAPSDAESGEVAGYLANRTADRAAAAQELVWALFCSTEFRFNH
jgi:hypothetical protein